MEISDLDNVLRLTTNRYIITIAVTKRAEEIYDTATIFTKKLNPLGIAIKELVENKLKIRAPGFLED